MGGTLCRSGLRSIEIEPNRPELVDRTQVRIYSNETANEPLVQ